MVNDRQPLTINHQSLTMKASIVITLKKSLFDAQGATVQKALHHLGYTNVKDLRIGKFITIELDGDNPAALKAQVEEMCQKLLANPIIEEFRVEMDGQPVKAIEEMKVASPPKPRKKGKLRDTAPMKSRLFQLTREEFVALPPEEAGALPLQMWKENEEWLDEQFAVRDAKWLLVVGGKILASYPDDCNLPSEEELHQIEQREGKMGMLLGHEDEEQIEESVDWSAVAEEDAYPTLPVSVAHPQCSAEDLEKQALSYVSDLDTGSPFVLLNYDELLSHRIIRMQQLINMRRKQHLGRSYTSCRLPVALWVEDERGEKHRLDYHCECVLEWNSSPFRLTNPRRQALVGRPLLLEFPLTVELDGAKKQSKVKRVGRRRKKK